MTDTTFRGWPPEALRWFDGLAAHNDRAWFADHRATYDDSVRGPMEALLGELALEFGEGIVSRPNRDVRFSKDKSPYKLRIYARVPQASGGLYYVDLRSEGLFVGGGVYLAERAELGRLRTAIADDRTGAELVSIVARLRSAGIDLMEDRALKTAPRGYPVDHPRIELLRLPSLAAGRLHPPRKWLGTRAAKDRVVDGWRAVTPLIDWISANT